MPATSSSRRRDDSTGSRRRYRRTRSTPGANCRRPVPCRTTRAGCRRAGARPTPPSRTRSRSRPPHARRECSGRSLRARPGRPTGRTRPAVAETPPSPSRKAAPEAPSSSLRCLAAAPAPTRGRPRPADTRPAANRSRARRPPRTPLSVGSGRTLVRGRPRAGHSPRPPEPGRTSAPRTMLAARSLGREPARSRPDNRRVQPELPEPPRASKTPGHLKNRPVHCQFRP